MWRNALLRVNNHFDYQTRESKNKTPSPLSVSSNWRPLHRFLVCLSHHCHHLVWSRRQQCRSAWRQANCLIFLNTTLMNSRVGAFGLDFEGNGRLSWSPRWILNGRTSHDHFPLLMPSCALLHVIWSCSKQVFQNAIQIHHGALPVLKSPTKLAHLTASCRAVARSNPTMSGEHFRRSQPLFLDSGAKGVVKNLKNQSQHHSLRESVMGSEGCGNWHKSAQQRKVQLCEACFRRNEKECLRCPKFGEEMHANSG